MARKQTLTTYPNKTVASHLVPEKLFASQKFVCAVVIEALSTNTDFVYIGDSSNQLFALSPGKAFSIEGDKLDHGTQAYVDISTLWVRSNVDGEGVSFMTTDGF